MHFPGEPQRRFTDGPASRPSTTPGRLVYSPPTTMRQLAEEAASRRRFAESDVDLRADQRHRHHGKRSARERIERLLDPGTFVELRLFARQRGHRLRHGGPQTPTPTASSPGGALVDGRKVFVFAHDSRIFGGALGRRFAAKIHKLMDLAESIGAPIIGLNDGGGARIQEGVGALAGFGGIFRRNVARVGCRPADQCGPRACAGGAAYSPALTDFVFMVRDAANMFITGPDVVAAVTGEQVTHEELGGADSTPRAPGSRPSSPPDEDGLPGGRPVPALLPARNNQEEPPP